MGFLRAVVLPTAIVAMAGLSMQSPISSTQEPYISGRTGQPILRVGEDTDLNSDVKIINNCDFPVYIREVMGRAPDADPDTEPKAINDGAEMTLEAQGLWVSDIKVPKGAGVSIKIGKEPFIGGQAEPPITQLEYAVDNSTIPAGDLWYDLSNVDCYEDGNSAKCPFLNDGVYVNSWAGCRELLCGSGEHQCHDAYQVWNDDDATTHCAGQPSKLWLTLCPVVDEDAAQRAEAARHQH